MATPLQTNGETPSNLIISQFVITKCHKYFQVNDLCGFPSLDSSVSVAVPSAPHPRDPRDPRGPPAHRDHGPPDVHGGAENGAGAPGSVRCDRASPRACSRLKLPLPRG